MMIIDNFHGELYEKSLKNIILNNIFQNCKTEEDVRKTLEIETNRILHLIEAIPPEKNIIFKSETSVSGGFIDSEYRNIIIEYKKYRHLGNAKNLNEARKQLFKYLSDERFIGNRTYGFLFDGYIMESYVKTEENQIESIKHSLNGPLTMRNLDFFFRTAFLSSYRELSSKTIREDFSLLGSSYENDSRKLVKKLFSMLMKKYNKRTELLFSEWKKMFKLAETDSGKHGDIQARRLELTAITGQEIIDAEREYFAIFSLHTAFSIIIKLIALKVVGKFSFQGNEVKFKDLINLNTKDLKNFFYKLEMGDLFKEAGLINLVEGDFFSWYSRESWDEEIVRILKSFILIMDKYEDIKLKKYHILEDLFRDLYESFIPSIVRHSFGEYYTPYWLADSVVENAIKHLPDSKKCKFSVIDPCCGSGTFLINVLHRRVKTLENNNVSFYDLVDGIVGVDLNPLAVLMARINIYINTIPYIEKSNKKIEIPIYVGDSTYSPELIKIDNIECLTYDLLSFLELIGKPFEIILPYELVIRDDFIRIMDNLESKIVSKNPDAAFKYMNSVFEFTKYPRLEKSIKALIDELIDLEYKDLNSIWLRIFSNYLKTGTFKKFDVIVGNPPWVSWGVLPENYREKVKRKCRFEGLFSDDSNTGGNNLNVCALIANKVTEKWLSKDGTLNFLMPKSILFNKSFEGFRNFTIYNDGQPQNVYLYSVIDWSRAGRPFENVSLPFCTYTFGFERKEYKNGIPYVEVIKKGKTKLSRHTTFDFEKEKFEFNNKVLTLFTKKNNNNFTILDNEEQVNLVKKIIGENEYNFRTGVDAKYPLRLKFVSNIDDNLAEFAPYTKRGHKLVVSNKTVILEKKLVKPFIVSPDITENGLQWSENYLIFPYENLTTQPISSEQLRLIAPNIYDYLHQNIHILSSGSNYNKRIQKLNEFYGILRVGLYSFANVFVAIRDNTKMVSAIISDIKTHWGTFERPLLDSHISYISERKKGTTDFISKQEAIYINNILNLPIVKLYIENSSDSRSIGTKFRVRIPKYVNYTDFINKNLSNLNLSNDTVFNRYLELIDLSTSKQKSKSRQ